MSEADIDSLFRELKPDVESLANPLFDASRDFVRARGAFLPHGAVLSTSGEVRLVMGLPPDSEEGQVSTRPDNAPSQRVILAYRGVLVEEFTAPAAFGGHRHLRYRVQLDDRTSR